MTTETQSQYNQYVVHLKQTPLYNNHDNGEYIG